MKVQRSCKVIAPFVKQQKSSIGSKRNKNIFGLMFVPLIPAPLKLQEEKQARLCVISLSCFLFLAIYSVDSLW